MKFLLCVLCVLCGGAFSSSAAAPKEAFEQAATQLKFLDAGDLLYGRLPDRINPPEDMEAHNKIVSELFARNDSFDDLAALLKDGDPKVRTLVVAALNSKNDPKLLPLLVPLCEDTAATLPHPGLVAMIPGMDKDITPLEPQTVADFPKAILRQYVRAAGCDTGDNDFEVYWTPRKDRPFCASWFKVDLIRATQDVRPIPANRQPQLHALRKRIDRLSEKDRAWTILYLSAADPVLFDDAVCLAAAKTLGDQALLKSLQGKCPSDDPDLHPCGTDGGDPVAPINLWALKHAKALFRPELAEEILSLDQGDSQTGTSHGLKTPWYAIAAAELAPQRSKAILLDAFKRFGREGYRDAWNRSDLASALWRQQGTSAVPFLLNWFYGETLKDEGVPHSRARFLESLDAKSADTRKLLAAIIAEPRFATLDWSSLKTLIPILNQWTAKPVVTADEMQSLHHPYGEQHVVEQADQAAQIYPAQTKALNQTLNDWRQKIRASTEEWFH
jgi:hypothetical protein